MHVLLVEPEYYTQYPPLGLLKLSAYHKAKGDTTELVKGRRYPKATPDLIYVTSLFTWAWRPVWEAIKYYKAWFHDVELWLGGLYASLLPDHASLSGADHIYKGIFSEAEDMMPDYTLRPDWDGSIIFASRGCVRNCGFCAVPVLEGKISSVKYSIKPLVWPGHEKREGCCDKKHHTRVIFFDNNILASPAWRNIFEELHELGLKVDFNQGLDASLISDEVAEKLANLKRDSWIRISYDLRDRGPYVEKAIERLNATGINGRRIMVYTLFNYTDDPQDFFERIKEILNWGAVAYPMRYIPIYALEKNGYVAPRWDPKRLDMVQRARRVIGYGGSFPPYEGLVNKFNKAKDFDEAFGLYPPKRRST